MSSAEPTFEELMAELEGITAKLAAGDLGIEAAADLYERAERLHALATERLKQVRARVEGLAGPAGPAGGRAGQGRGAQGQGAEPTAGQGPV
ncbi:MAG TPA: exodeoxyribonuclease VII small subunit [Acidimicrobiales bacterium]|nr:exodeoxyribonuclease VII small subunit [Acidimicrobiales bacterium]